MKLKLLISPILALSLLTLSHTTLPAAADAPSQPTETAAPAKQPTDPKGLLKSLKDVQVLVKGIQEIGGVILTLFSFGDLAAGLSKTTNPLFDIINEFDKETPDTNKVILKLEEMQKAQSLILKDAERIVKVVVAPVSLFSPIVIKNLRKQGKVIEKNGIEMVEIQRCLTKDVVEKVTVNGKLVDQKKQTIEVIKQEIPVKDAAKYITDFVVCQIFKLLNSYYQAVEVLLHKYIEIQNIAEKAVEKNILLEKKQEGAAPVIK